MDRNFDDDDEKPAPRSGRVFEFECPDCNAHNPYHDGFADGDEVLCFYCGTEFKVRLAEGRVKLKAT
jgi:hypothetical protein